MNNMDTPSSPTKECRAVAGAISTVVASAIASVVSSAIASIMALAAVSRIVRVEKLAAATVQQPNDADSSSMRLILEEASVVSSASLF